MAKVNFLALARLAAQQADDKKARDIVILNVRRLTPVTDYFVIATADSTPQINAVAGAIETTFKETGGLNVLHRDGRNSGSWVVLDYGGVTIHVMSEQSRKLFALEKIWSEAKKVK